MPKLWQGYRGNMWATDNFYRVSLTDSLEHMLQETIDTGRIITLVVAGFTHMKLTTQGLELK